MRRLKTDTDLRRVFSEDPLIGHHDKPCRIFFVIINMLFQYVKPEYLRSKFACNCRLCLITLLSNLLCCQRRIVIRNLAPLWMAVQIFLALCQGLGMGIDSLNVRKLRPRQAKQRMLTFHDLLSDNIIFEIYKQVIIVCHDPGRRIFNRKHRIICGTLCDRLHRIAE